LQRSSSSKKQKEFAAWYSSSTGKLLLAKELEHLSQQRISKQAYAPAGGGGTRSKLHIPGSKRPERRVDIPTIAFNGEAREEKKV
jgi:hypothetical protein